MHFIDYQKAFGTVDHRTLRKTLLEMGFLQHLIHPIKELYSNHKATVRTAYGLKNFLAKESGKATTQKNVYSEKNYERCSGGL